MDLDYKDIEEGEIDLPINRSLYLNQLLKGIKGTEIVKTKNTKNSKQTKPRTIRRRIWATKNIKRKTKILPKTGYTWLKY